MVCVVRIQDIANRVPASIQQHDRERGGISAMEDDAKNPKPVQAGDGCRS